MRASRPWPIDPTNLKTLKSPAGPTLQTVILPLNEPEQRLEYAAKLWDEIKDLRRELLAAAV